MSERPTYLVEEWTLRRSGLSLVLTGISGKIEVQAVLTSLSDDGEAMSQYGTSLRLAERGKDGMTVLEAKEAMRPGSFL